MISLIIPTTTSNKNYTNNIIRNIRDLYPNEDEVEIILEENDNVNLGINYNNAVAKAKGDKIILLHNDMAIKPGFVETMDKHIVKGRITTYTRVEPPIYMDTYPGKVIADFGSDLSTFDEKKFNNFNLEENLIDGGSQLFFGCMREDYIGIDGYTFKLFCEDDDLHLRYKIAGFEHKVSSAHVYHFVSKTSRAIEDYQQIERNSNRNFIRKWGSRKPSVKYNIAYVVHNCQLTALETLELFCDRIYVTENFNVGRMWDYVELEQENTSFDLSKRVLTIKNNDPVAENDIVVEFDLLKFNPASFNILQQLPNIIKESGEVGTFELDIFTITITSMDEYQNDLIFISKQQ
jgi:glycosyltransferase involved in cell wall biosynthesis